MGYYTFDEGAQTALTYSKYAAVAASGDTTGRGLHSFPFQLNLSSSVHRITKLNS